MKYAQILMAEAIQAEQSGHTVAAVEKCRDVSEHALKAIFNITGIDIEKYKNLEDAIIKELKTVFDKPTVDQLKDYYLSLKSHAPEEFKPRECIEKASFIVKKATELFGK